jgi:hypothetical protein
VEADYRSWEGKVNSAGVFVSTVEFADRAFEAVLARLVDRS